MKWHDHYIKDKAFKPGDWALLYDSRYKDNLGKLQTRWLGPYEIVEIFSNGVVRLATIDPVKFKLLVNGHRLRLYYKPLSKMTFYNRFPLPSMPRFLQQLATTLPSPLHLKIFAT